MPHAQLFVTADYLDPSQADGGRVALRRLYAELGAPHEFDAVTIARKASGEARFYAAEQDGRRSGEADDTTWSLAAGLAAALFPSVGADDLSRLAIRRTVLAAVAGEVGRSLGRRALMALGSQLDDSGAGLVVAARAERGTQVLDVLRHARGVATWRAVVDVVRVERFVAAAGVVRC